MTLPPMTLQERLRATESMRAHGHHEAADTCELAAAELDRLHARVAELEADAERYRWLRQLANRETAHDRYKGARWWLAFHEEAGTANNFSAAIDTARKAKP